MQVSFQKPVLLPDKGCHSFTLLDVPVFEAVSESSAILIDFSKDCSGQLLDLINSFLLNANQYFSKELPASVFLQRVRHKWITTEFSSKELQFEGFALLKWIPATILFYRGYYEIEWDLLEIIPVPAPTRPSLPEPEPLPTQPSLPEPQLEEVEIPSATTPTDPNPSQSPPLTETTIKRNMRDAYKQKVRKARLRATLAQLRAEKLAEQYYLRYGNLDLGDGGESSDSDLSFQD
jgi:hypothetical protein